MQNRNAANHLPEEISREGGGGNQRPPHRGAYLGGLWLRHGATASGSRGRLS